MADDLSSLALIVNMCYEHNVTFICVCIHKTCDQRKKQNQIHFEKKQLFLVLFETKYKISDDKRQAETTKTD